jgi:hypothetical protein
VLANACTHARTAGRLEIAEFIARCAARRSPGGVFLLVVTTVPNLHLQRAGGLMGTFTTGHVGVIGPSQWANRKLADYFSVARQPGTGYRENRWNFLRRTDFEIY